MYTLYSSQRKRGKEKKRVKRSCTGTNCSNPRTGFVVAAFYFFHAIVPRAELSVEEKTRWQVVAYLGQWRRKRKKRRTRGRSPPLLPRWPCPLLADHHRYKLDPFTEFCMTILKWYVLVDWRFINPSDIDKIDISTDRTRKEPLLAQGKISWSAITWIVQLAWVSTSK